jgi:hypothetical protein
MPTEPLPAQVGLTLYRGDTRIWDDAFAIDGEPMDLTGYDFTAQIRATLDSDDVLAVIDVTPVDLAAGRIRRTLTAEEAQKLAVGKAYWDLQLVRQSDGFTRTYLAGTVKVVGDVSRQ